MIRRAMLLLVLVALLPLATKAASDQGKVHDRPALARVESYCVDIASLADDEALIVSSFLKEQSKPKGLLKDLRWKRLESCQDSAADATIKLEFPFLNNFQVAPGGTRITTREERDRLKGVLRVHEGSTTTVLYTAEALPLESAYSDPEMYGGNLYQRRLDALRRVFSKLIHDVKPLPPRPAQ